MEMPKQLIGRTIRARRLELHLTQAELAEKLELDARYLQKIERGVCVPAIKTFYRIAHVLNLSLDQLFFPANNETSPTHAMLLRRIQECDEKQEKVLLATVNAMLEKE